MGARIDKLFLFLAACFLLLHFAVSLLLWSLKLNLNLNGYIKMTWWKFLTDGLQQYALSFMLFWTLFYGLVYLY
jgi:EMC6